MAVYFKLIFIVLLSRSPKWEGVSMSDVPRANRDDGELWINLDDFTSLFDQVTICSLTPDFDQDGKPDKLGNTATTRKHVT